MTEMVKNGEITREQMQQRIDRMKKMMAKEKTITREDIAEAKTKMQKMVEAGEITEEQMQQRLNEMRRTMRSQLGNQRDARAEYKRMEGRLMQAVEAGKMSSGGSRPETRGIRQGTTSQGRPWRRRGQGRDRRRLPRTRHETPTGCRRW